MRPITPGTNGATRPTSPLLPPRQGLDLQWHMWALHTGHHHLAHTDCASHVVDPPLPEIPRGYQGGQERQLEVRGLLESTVSSGRRSGRPPRSRVLCLLPRSWPPASQVLPKSAKPFSQHKTCTPRNHFKVSFPLRLTGGSQPRGFKKYIYLKQILLQMTAL